MTPSQALGEPFSAADVVALSALLDSMLAMPEDGRDAWIAALAPAQRPHAKRLQRSLQSAAAEGGEGFLSRLPVLTHDDRPAKAGDVVGPYRLIRELGRGGMGCVWLAEPLDPTKGGAVALKLPRYSAQPDLAIQLASEAEICANLDDPRVVHVQGTGVDADGRPYLALEYLQGDALDVWCTRRRLGLRRRLELVLGVARAVAHVHAMKVVHRDLKPSNVIVTGDGLPHLIDFGIAQRIPRVQQRSRGLMRTGPRMLTPHYAAPEQRQGRCDGYSVDVTLPLNPEALSGLVELCRDPAFLVLPGADVAQRGM